MLALVALFVISRLTTSLTDNTYCTFETLRGGDGDFCRKGLEVLYPGLDASCSVIPNCAEYRESLMSDWGPPEVKFPFARADKKYVLIMVDPDAPNRAEPTMRFWRHWLVKDISGQNLIDGNMKGKVISEYQRPHPPHGAGYHRYQFFLYEQPVGEDISMTDRERGHYAIKTSFTFAAVCDFWKQQVQYEQVRGPCLHARGAGVADTGCPLPQWPALLLTKGTGSWDMDKFVENFRLGTPEATSQFMTRNV
ncbi:phosphatidylethanolamine-binding protein 4 [Lissotriton helveticus]